jgi:hypothetical protein
MKDAMGPGEEGLRGFRGTESGLSALHGHGAGERTKMHRCTRVHQLYDGQARQDEGRDQALLAVAGVDLGDAQHRGVPGNLINRIDEIKAALRCGEAETDIDLPATAGDRCVVGSFEVKSHPR